MANGQRSVARSERLRYNVQSERVGYEMVYVSSVAVRVDIHSHSLWSLNRDFHSGIPNRLERCKLTKRPHAQLLIHARSEQVKHFQVTVLQQVPQHVTGNFVVARQVQFAKGVHEPRLVTRFPPHDPQHVGTKGIHK